MTNLSDEDYSVFDALPLIGIFAAGVLIGGLAGATSMLLLAPQSGERTRRQIRRRALEIRDQVSDSAEEARDLAEARVDDALDSVRKLRKGARQRIDDIQQHGQDLVDDQRERVNSAVEAGKDAVRRRAFSR